MKYGTTDDGRDVKEPVRGGDLTIPCTRCGEDFSVNRYCSGIGRDKYMNRGKAPRWCPSCVSSVVEKRPRISVRSARKPQSKAAALSPLPPAPRKTTMKYTIEYEVKDNGATVVSVYIDGVMQKYLTLVEFRATANGAAKMTLNYAHGGDDE